MSRHKKHPLFCLRCGKNVDFLIDGKYCSKKCMDLSWHIEKGSRIFCNNCGTLFTALSKSSRFCPDCTAKRPNCLCFYPTCSKRIQKKKICNLSFNRKFIYVGNKKNTQSNHDGKTCQEINEDMCLKKKQRRPRRSIDKWTNSELLRYATITELALLARKRGFSSYGKFEAYLRCHITKG